MEILDEQESLVVPVETIRLLAVNILDDAAIQTGKISVVVVDNETIHDLNREFLRHDYPTDVLSFLIEEDKERHLLEGEIVVSSEMALERAPEYQWPPEQELLLYIVHGLLHLVGYEDDDRENRAIMRGKEKEYLAAIDIVPPVMPDDDQDDVDETNGDSSPEDPHRTERN